MRSERCSERTLTFHQCVINVIFSIIWRRGWLLCVFGACNKCVWRQVRIPPGLCVCAACRLLRICPRVLRSRTDALRTVLNAGLHHSCRLQRGGCNPIPFVGAVVQPAKRKRALLCALTLLFLHSSPFLPSITLFLPLICSLPARRRTSLRNRRSALFTHRPSPFKSTWYDGAFPPLSFFYYFFFFSFPLLMSLPVESTACTPVRWRARACSHQSQRRIYLRVHCPHTVRAISPPRTQIWTSPIVTEKQRKKGGKHTGLQGWGSTAL